MPQVWRPRILLAVTAVAFLAGTVAPAAGATLTKGMVRKIAAQVVRKHGPAMSVAHATTADRAGTATTAGDATTVGGRSAASLGTTVYEFQLGAVTAKPVVSRQLLGLPPGQYLMGYSVSFTISDPSARPMCWVSTAPESIPELGLDQPIPRNNSGACTGTAMVTVTPSSDLRFWLAGNGGTVSPLNESDFRSSVTFTRVDSVVAGTVS